VESSIRVLKKLKTELSYNPELSLLGIYLKECKSDYITDTCVPMFIALLFTSYRTSPDALQLINGLRKLYIYKYYSSIKKNGIMSFADKWMELEIIMLSEVSQVWKDKGNMFSHICERQI
jgi:hypothetical protein